MSHSDVDDGGAEEYGNDLASGNTTVVSCTVLQQRCFLGQSSLVGQVDPGDVRGGEVWDGERVNLSLQCPVLLVELGGDG